MFCRCCGKQALYAVTTCVWALTQARELQSGHISGLWLNFAIMPAALWLLGVTVRRELPLIHAHYCCVPRRRRLIASPQPHTRRTLTHSTSWHSLLTSNTVCHLPVIPTSHALCQTQTQRQTTPTAAGSSGHTGWRRLTWMNYGGCGSPHRCPYPAGGLAAPPWLALITGTLTATLASSPL